MNANAPRVTKSTFANLPGSNAHDETAQRAAQLYDVIDRRGLAKAPAEQIVRQAMEKGASTAEDFQRAFQNAGISTERAKAFGELTEMHFAIATEEKATEIGCHNHGAAQGNSKKRFATATTSWEFLKQQIVVGADIYKASQIRLSREPTRDEWQKAINEYYLTPEAKSHFSDVLWEYAKTVLDKCDASNWSKSAFVCADEVLGSAGWNATGARGKFIRVFLNQWLEWTLVACFTLALFIVPWRYGRHDPAPYGPIFWGPFWSSQSSTEIDATRYFIQVFAVAAVCGIVYVKALRDRNRR